MRLLTLVSLIIVLSLSLLFLGICGAFKGEQGEPGDSVTQTELTALVNEALTNRMDEVKGPQGGRGSQGPQGAKGDQGDQGDAGITGGQGIKGDKGDKGPIGLRGKEGPQGEVGPRGIQGFPGPQGLAGLPGTIADLDSPTTLSGLDFDLSVSQASWVSILAKSVTITKPSKVLIIASANAAMSCSIDSQCDYFFWLNVSTDLEDTTDAREIRVSQMKRQMTLPIALNRVVSLQPGEYSVKLSGFNDTPIGPLIQNVLLTTLVIED